MYVDVARTYIGLVEANLDPKKLGRCKIRVADVFDDLPTEDIPWSSPRKDVNGNTFNIPDIGKFVTVKFDNGNIYSPEYYYSDMYNQNLEKKLKGFSESTYLSMKSLMFDEKTQIYSCNDDGLIMDYKFNTIQITESKINLSLRDSFAKLHIGDEKATEAFILGTNFLSWFSEFIEVLVGSNAFHGNFGVSIFASPPTIEVCKKYLILKDSYFLSDNVKVASNFKISSMINRSSNRPNEGVKGDEYQSTAPFSNINQTITESSPAPTPISPVQSSSQVVPSENTTSLDTTGSQQIENFGKLVVSSNKSSPTLICFGGIDVKGRESGDYMWDYFGQLKNKFQIFVAKNHNVDGEESYKSVIKYLESNGYNTSEQILYLFSGGYKPAIPVLNRYESKFSKFILVDIWIGNDNISTYYVNLAKKNRSKTYYIYTSFGPNNSQGSKELARNSFFSKLKPGGSMTDHMDCNKLAIDILLPEESKSPPDSTTSTSPKNDQIISGTASTDGSSGSSTKSSCERPYTDANLNKGWIGKQVTYVKTKIDPAIEGPKLTAKYGRVLSQAMLATMKIEQGFVGFNYNIGGFDITSGGWQYNPDYHDGYVVLPEGGTKKCKAFIAFKSFDAFIEQKVGSFKRKGFEQATDEIKYAQLYFEKWNGRPADKIDAASQELVTGVWRGVGKYV